LHLVSYILTRHKVIIMETKHLTETEITLCAEALATDSAARTVCDASKLHLKNCEICTKQVNSISEIIRQKYNEEIVIGLNRVKKPKRTFFAWLGISISLILLFILGVFLMSGFSNIS